jgi:F420 biosynthesis protein FbiB-like protein
MNSPLARKRFGAEEEARSRLWRGLAINRRSVRRYTAEPVEPALIDHLLELAVWAPSAHNRQPWRFVPITAAARKHVLATAMGRRLRQDRLGDGEDLQAVDADVARSYNRLTNAPALILVCLDPSELDFYPDERRRRAEHLMAVQSVAMAVQNLQLAAHAEGLGACIMCAPLFCGEVVVEALDLPAHWEPQVIVTLGHPANAGKTPSRKALAEVIWPLP